MLMESSVLINAPAAEVFDRYIEVENWPQWTETMTTVQRLEPGKLAIGSRVRIKQPKLREMVWQVTDFQPGRSFTWVARSPGLVTTARHVVIPRDDAAMVHLSVEQSGPLGIPAGLLTKRLTDKYLAIESAGLKKLCEQVRR